MKMSAPGRAVVIGGGVAGLLSAAALQRHADEVVVLERDIYSCPSLPGPPTPRSGAPQSRCLHMLTLAGMRSFDALVPGWREDVEASGGRLFDLASAAWWRLPAGWLSRFESGLNLYACSRNVLEATLRRCVLAFANVRIVEERRVDGLLHADDGRVCGVRHGDAASRAGDEQELQAVLVVDAAGRGSIIPQWCRGAGLAPVRESSVPTRWRYCSQWLELDPEHAPEWNVLSIPPAGHFKNGVLIFRAEGPYWGVVSLTPKDSEVPDEAGILDIEKILDDDTGAGHPVRASLERFCHGAKRVSSVFHLGNAKSCWRHYEDIEDWPAGLVALGDSVCALDPSHGLGMTTAALAAEMLGESVASAPRGLGELSTLRFQSRLAELNLAPWKLTTGRDPGDEAPNLKQLWAIRTLGHTALHSQEVAQYFLEVRQMLRPVPEFGDS